MKNVKTKIEDIDVSKKKIEIIVDWEKVNEFKGKALEKLKKKISVDGFRKGHASTAAIIAKVGEMGILQEASSLTIDNVFPQIISSEKIKMLGYPSISVTKLSPNNPMEFTVEVSIYPEIKLPNYKKIANEIKKDIVKVTDEDYKKVVDNVLAMHNRTLHQEHKHKDGEKCEIKEVKKLTTDVIANFGSFKTIDEFKEKVLEDLKKEKEFDVVSKYRGDIAESILKETKFSIPKILTDSEEDKIIAQMKDDIQKMGMTYEDYLKNSGKTEENIRKEIRPEAEKRAKIEIILKEIAQAEKLSPNQEELTKQIQSITALHPNVEANNIKLYVENILLNEEVMKFLEK